MSFLQLILKIPDNELYAVNDDEEKLTKKLKFLNEEFKFSNEEGK